MSLLLDVVIWPLFVLGGMIVIAPIVVAVCIVLLVVIIRRKKNKRVQNGTQEQEHGKETDEEDRK